MLNLKLKANTRTMTPKAYVYMNGLLIGEVREHSSHFRGREYKKSLSFTPVEGSFVPRATSDSWVQKKLLVEVEHRLREKMARLAVIVAFARSLVEA